VHNDVKKMLTSIHRRLQGVFSESSLQARTLMNLELAVIYSFFEMHQLSLPDVHAFDAWTLFNDFEYGLAWPEADGWRQLAMNGNQILPFDMNEFASIELSGPSPMTIYPHGERRAQNYQVIDMNHDQVISIVNDLFKDGFNGLSLNAILQVIRKHMQGYEYIVESRHEWQSLNTIFINNGGDCEDLAHLEASLILRALTDAGFHDVAESLELLTGYVGKGARQIGHTIIQLFLDGQAYVIDSTMSDGPLLGALYRSFFGFEQIISYGLMATSDTLAQARRIDTKSLTDFVDGLSDLNDENRAKTDILKERFLSGLGMTNYAKTAVAFYDAVTNENINSTFWNANNADAQALAAEQMQSIPAPTYQALDAQTTVYVGKDVKRYDTRDGLAGLMEINYNRMQEMSDNLTSNSLNKYVGQLYNGYFIYDYSRIMGDYTEIMNAIQMATCFLTAQMTYANSFNWIGSQLSYDNEPNSEVKARQRFVKNVQNSLLKMVDEIEYFIPLFTQTYDDLNQGTYGKYQQEVVMKFQNINSSIKDIFELGSETIMRNQLSERVELEWAVVNMMLREKVMQSEVIMPNSRALASYVNFSTPYSDLLNTDPGSPASFANFASQMELDIEAGVYKPVQTSNNQVLYISALQYYFSYYYHDAPGDIQGYTTAEGPTDSDSREPIAGNDFKRFIDKSLGSVYSAVGLTAMEENNTFYDYPDWVKNVVIDSSQNGDYDTYKAGDNTPITTENYKLTSLYKYIHSKGAKYHERFENEGYTTGDDGKIYAASITNGKWQATPKAKVQYKERKRRLHAYDFTDILEYTANGSKVSGTNPTSKSVWDDLISKGYIDQYGNFNQKFVNKMIGSSAANLVNDLGLSNFNDVNNEIKTAIGQRMYNTCPIDEYQYGIIEYDFTRPQLFTRGSSSLKTNGYLDPYAGESISSGWQFLTDYFSGGPSAAMSAAMAQTTATIGESANSQTIPVPTFADFNVTKWGLMASQNVSMIGGNGEPQQFSVEEVRSYLYNETGDKFWSDLTITKEQQKKFYMKSLNTDSSGNPLTPSGYTNGRGKSYQGLFSCHDFVNQTASNPDDVNTQALASPMIGTPFEDVGAVAQPVLPSPSLSYDYDYGAMTKLPYDDRIVTLSNESLFPNQGGIPLGEIQWVYNEDKSADLSNPDNNNMKGIYSSVFNDLPTDDLNKIRLKNSLEKPLTPGYSYNDQNTVFSASQMAGWLNMNRQSDTFRDLISAMISKDYIIPTFQRIESGNNQGYYSLMGYTITEKYVSAANFNDLPSIDGINEQQVVIDLRNDHINGALTSAWKSGSFDQMAKFLYSGRDQFNSGFLDNDDRKYQLLRWTGQTVDGPILGMNSPMPFMSYDWHAIKAAHNGMVSIQNRVRLFYFISQAYISSIQSVNKRLDGLASSGIFGIEADSQLFEKRVAKQTEQLAQVSAKTSQFVELNNAFYKQQINTIKASDVGIRVAKGVALYGDLAAAPMYLAAVPLYAAAPADPSGNTLFWANFFYFFAAGLQVASMIGELTEKSINLAHTYGIPQKMTPLLYADTLSSDQAESSSLIEQARQTFKRMTQYKSPISFNNGDKWTTNGVPNDYDLKRIYDNFSPLKNTEYLYVNEALGQDVWQGYSELEESKKGDCEDYAMLAASLASASSSYSGQLRVVNGLIGYGGNAPRSHTVLLYDPGNDPFAIQNAPTPFESKKVFKNANTIQVIDLTSPLKNETDFYTLEEYQALYGYFQPVYSYDKPNETTANTGYGFEDYEIFGYTPSAASPGPPLPGPQTGKGPINFSGLSDGTYTYNIDQNSTRPVMTIYSGGSLVQTRTLTAKIEFGKKQYKTTDPTGKSVTLDLPPQNYESDDQIDPVENEGQVEGNVNSKLSSSGGISFNKSSMDLGKAGSGFSATDSAVPYASSAVFPQISGGSGSGSIWGSDIVTNQMQEIITLEMEEHALLNEMFTLAVDEDSRIDASKNDLGFAVYDWPAFQQLQRRLFVVQTKMKKMFLIMKLRSEFYSLIGTRLGDFERQQVGSAMDSIFNAHFSQVQNSVESIQSLMMSMQSARQSNFDIDKQREQAIWDLAFKTPMNIVMGLISFKPIDGVFWTAFTKGMLGVLNKVIVFFGAPRNDYYLKSTQELRESSLMANPSGTLSSIQSLYNLQNSSSSYDEWDSPIYSSSGKIAYSKESLESGETLTTQEIYNRQVDTKYSLTVNDVVDNYWKTNKKGYYTPSIKDSYFGNMRDYSNNTVAANNFTQKSLEDHVMEWMTTRYFPESGDELMFLDSVVYSMAGTKMASDIQFFDWIQNRLCAEMMRQIIFSMYTSTLKSLAANLGHGQNGGNDAISMSTSLTGDVGQHYFHLQTTLSTWEQAQIQVANRRFAGYKELDSIILEGIIAVGTAALTAGLSGLAEAASGFSQIFLQLFSGLTLVSLQIVGQLTQLIYQSVDANEKNQVLEDLSKEPDSDSEDVSLDKDNEDYNMTDAQRT
ncbi:MAG: hypothetical protein VW397_01555, partial [Candidatus Margulisiibacteriota bacterium]